MRIDKVSADSFRGNVRYTDILGEKEKQFAKERRYRVQD